MAHLKGEDNYKRIEEVARNAGADLVSAAPVSDDLVKTFHSSVRDALSPLKNAIVIGVRLSSPVLDTIKDAPTWSYYHHYRTVNLALDQIALRTAVECERLGGKAYPVPASQILDWDRLKGHLSHREAGAAARLGWWGRNNLLVNPDYGSQVRYVTVLTDIPLSCPRYYTEDELSGCGDCRLCIDACPVGAIGGNPEEFHLDRCTAQLRRFSKSERLNTLICGLCIKVCPGRVGTKR